jgi:hypothetical protein
VADHRDGPIFPDRNFAFRGMAFKLPQFKDPNFALPTTSDVQAFSFEGYPTPRLSQEQVNHAVESLARFSESLPEDEQKVLDYLIRLAEAASAVL